MKSWKTTLGGILAALGSAATAAYTFGGMPMWLGSAGAGATAAGMILLGVAARDNGVTSKQAGAE